MTGAIAAAATCVKRRQSPPYSTKNDLELWRMKQILSGGPLLITLMNVGTYLHFLQLLTCCRIRIKIGAIFSKDGPKGNQPFFVIIIIIIIISIILIPLTYCVDLMNFSIPHKFRGNMEIETVP